MPEPTILAGPQDLTAEWLTDALIDGGSLPSGTPLGDVRVTRCASEPLGEGVGILGQLVRISLDYDGEAKGAPSSLIAKFPSPAPENRAIGHGMGHYAAELDFYSRLGDQVSLRIPKPYYTALDRKTGDFTLLIEDLAPGEPGDQVAGSTRQQTTTAIHALAGFHAEWWDKVDTPEMKWMRSFDDEALGQVVQGACQGAWGPCVANFGDGFTASALEVGERLMPKVAMMMADLAAPPRTIIHGDFRLDNLVFGEIAGGGDLAVIDCHISAKGRGPYDVGYHMSQSLDPDLRAELEEPLMRDYHRILVEGGVRDYSFDQAWRDYRLAVVFCLLYPVLVLGVADLGNERGLALGRALLTRCVRAIDDLNAGELIPD